MPVIASLPGTSITIEWSGEEFTRSVQRLLRGAMLRGGAVGVARAREEVNKDTEALMNSIEALVPRRGTHLLTYTLEIGVFEDHPGNYEAPTEKGNTRPDDLPTEYAYWQELMHPYLAPGMQDAVEAVVDRVRDGLSRRGLDALAAYVNAAEDVEEQVIRTASGGLRGGYRPGQTGRGGALTIGGFLSSQRAGRRR